MYNLTLLMILFMRVGFFLEEVDAELDLAVGMSVTVDVGDDALKSIDVAHIKERRQLAVFACGNISYMQGVFELVNIVLRCTFRELAFGHIEQGDGIVIVGIVFLAQHQKFVTRTHLFEYQKSVSMTEASQIAVDELCFVFLDQHSSNFLEVTHRVCMFVSESRCKITTSNCQITAVLIKKFKKNAIFYIIGLIFRLLGGIVRAAKRVKEPPDCCRGCGALG